MNRKIKNIVMIIIILVVAILSFFTMNEVKNNANKNMEPIFDKRQSERPFDRASMNNMESDDQSKKVMPSEESINDNSSNIGTKSRPQDMKQGMQNRENTMKKPEEMGEDFDRSTKQINKKDIKLGTLYYVVFGLESAIISIFIVYLVMSKFNKKNVRETMKGAKNISIYFIITIILEIIITFMQIMIVYNFFVNKTEPNIPNSNRDFNTNIVHTNNETTI